MYRLQMKKSSESIVEETIIPTESNRRKCNEEENATEENAPEVEVTPLPTAESIRSCAVEEDYFSVYEKRIRICFT